MSTIPLLLFVVLLAFVAVGWWARGSYDRRVEQERRAWREYAQGVER